MVPNTLFMGRKSIFLSVCASTNAEAQQLLIKNEATEGCLVYTAHQTNGRGQRGNSWEAEPGKNITLSVILAPAFLAARHQFYLSMAVSLAILDLVREQGLAKSCVKWPNDLYFEDKKLGGILIENTISGHFLQHSIVGIGLNINQTVFLAPTATSMSCVTGRQYDVAQLIARLMELLEKRYLALRQGKTEALKYEYLQALYRYQERHLFEVAGRQLTGQIIGVDEAGRLAIEIDTRLHFFNFQEISFVI